MESYPSSIYDHNCLRVDRFTTLFLYTCRLIYEEHREESGQFHTVRMDTQMRMLWLLEKGKTSQKERLDDQRTLSHYNVLQKWTAHGAMREISFLFYLLSYQWYPIKGSTT